MPKNLESLHYGSVAHFYHALPAPFVTVMADCSIESDRRSHLTETAIAAGSAADNLDVSGFKRHETEQAMQAESYT